jgi:hypothetical protein
MAKKSMTREDSEFRKLKDGLWYIRMPLEELIRRQKEPVTIPSSASPSKTSSDPSETLSKKGREV